MCKRMVKNLGMIVTGPDVQHKKTYSSICTTKTHHLVEQKLGKGSDFLFDRRSVGKEMP